MGNKIIKMPALGESVTEATLTNWVVQPGDKVERYDVLAEVESDKVTTEIPSDYAGTIKELLINNGDTVEIETDILVMDVEGSDDEAPSQEEAPSIDTVEPINPVTGEEDTEPQETATTDNQSADKPAQTNKKPNHAQGRLSPAVVRIAQEKNIDLSLVKGTGKGGRITRKDVLNFDPSSVSAAKEPTQPSGSMHDAVAKKVTETSQQSARKEQSATPSVSASQGSEIVPTDGVRKAIAKKMTQSVTEIPHAWLMMEADVSNIVKLRKSVKEAYKQKEGVSLSYFPFFVKAVAQALKKYPEVNTSWDNENIIYHKDINISIAVSTDTHLFVPVIKSADNLSISGLAKEINRLANGARTNTLKPDEMKGGTITVNNTGAFGSVQSMGIINHPQAAILQIESIKKRVVPTDEGGFKFADMINLCLSIDHRILDGRIAGNFMKEVINNLAAFDKESDIY